MEYMLLPRLLAVAEKAWAKENEWEHLSDSLQQENAYLQSLKNFINTIGKRELPRLDFYHNGFSYRIPPAGIKKENNFIIANTLFSEFAIRYTTDGSEPNIHSKLYQTPIKEKGIIKLKVFDKKGNSSAVSQIENL